MNNIAEWIIISIVTLGYLVGAYIYVAKRLTGRQIAYAVVSVLGMLAFMITMQCVSIHTFPTKLESLTAVAVCFPCAWVDAKEHKIPNVLVLSALIARVIIYAVRFFMDKEELLINLKGGGIALLLIVVFCLIGLLIVKDGIGMGDVKLLMVLALLLGLRSMFGALFFTLIASFFFSLYMLIIKKSGKKASIPFAPCILIGTFISEFLYIF